MITCPALAVATYYLGDELEPLQVWWVDATTMTLVDLSFAHTYEGKVVAAGETIFTTTTGFTGAAGDGTEDDGTPNLVKEWPTTGELNDLTASGPYIFQVRATRTADNKTHSFQIELDMKRIY